MTYDDLQTDREREVWEAAIDHMQESVEVWKRRRDEDKVHEIACKLMQQTECAMRQYSPQCTEVYDEAWRIWRAIKAGQETKP
jgi:hypothetical protein